MRITAASAIDGSIDAADVAAPDRADVWQSLSPSRAADFMACPLLYRFRVIDRLPERPSPAAVRGTVVHAVLERLFDLPAPERTPAAAVALLATEWAAAREADPGLDAMFAGDGELATWLDSARDLLRTYFTLEDPRQVEPAERE